MRPASFLLLVPLALALALAARSQEPDPFLAGSPGGSAAADQGCLTCHQGIEDAHDPKTAPVRKIGCTECHGGNAASGAPQGAVKASPDYERAKRAAHVAPRDPKVWKSSANPVRSYTALNRESLEFIRFVNPGDLRVARESCGSARCHPTEVTHNRKSMMAHGAMLWQAALYNNGAINQRRARYGEAYTDDGRNAAVVSQPTEDAAGKGALERLDPLPRWNVTQPGNILRVFERGGVRKPEPGIPSLFEAPGAPEVKLSSRGLGTQLRTDPVFLGLQKTRLLDPTLNFLGTNDHPGDFRSSGCTACHVLYANDREPAHSGAIARFGNRGLSASSDPTIPKDEPGHPIRHQLTRAIPSSQCIVCHVHPGTNVVMTYYGDTWWDNETDGQPLWPETQAKVSAKERMARLEANPEESAIRGRWGDRTFLENVVDLNPLLKRTQLSDYHGHGWLFRKVYKHDDKGSWLDAAGEVVPDDDPKKFEKAVHLKDIHLEKGMHCVDCHFKTDSHGDGNLYGEVRAATAIECADCHGTFGRKADLTMTGNAGGGESMRNSATAFGPRFVTRRGKITQQSSVDPDLKWEISQVADSISADDPARLRSSLAHTIQRDGMTWGTMPDDPKALAHADMSCYACHTAWAPSCFGCHLPTRANEKSKANHWEGTATRGWTTYNFQTLRDDVFMLGHDGTLKGNRITPIRSSCAVLVSSQDANRQWLYSQQQTVSAEGFSGQAFSPFTPHTVRKTETKMCTDCHVSQRGDNNARVAQLLGVGTGFVSFIGRHCWVAEGGGGVEAVVVTERDEPQAVYGSDLHQLAYPSRFQEHQAGGGLLKEAYRHGSRNAVSLQVRGEYLYIADGPGGLRVFDVANVDNKGYSQRIVTAPVSPLGQRLQVKTRNATAVASPSTMALDPTRSRNPDNLEGPIHPMYGYLYVTDSEEGLVVVPAATLLDGDPTNNFLTRALTWNPEGLLAGARAITLAGTTAYISCDAGLVLVSLDDPLKPRALKTLGRPWIVDPRAVAVQLRYAFVVDERGLKVVDVTVPEDANVVRGALVPIEGANDIYVARTYAYVPAGRKGLVIVDVGKPEDPALDQVYDAGGAIDDSRQVTLGMTNNSLFAYLADGRNGLRVIQLLSPRDHPGIWGFSPRPMPRLVATRKTRGPALAVSKGLDRDRAVDESGNQLGVFGRRGSRPMDLVQMRKMYLRDGRVWRVSNGPPRPPANARHQPGQPAGLDVMSSHLGAGDVRQASGPIMATRSATATR